MIPEWDINNVLPPIASGEAGHSTERSPYKTDLLILVETFATSKKRIEILSGLLDYRSALHQLEVVKGFQWLDGSFMENIEHTEDRPPNDIDVVTFLHIPNNKPQAEFFADHTHLFHSQETKERFSVDAYSTVLGQPLSKYDVKIISYWYSMWSHRRDHTWKGFLQIDLSPTHDNAARKRLKEIKTEYV